MDERIKAQLQAVYDKLVDCRLGLSQISTENIEAYESKALDAIRRLAQLVDLSGDIDLQTIKFDVEHVWKKLKSDKTDSSFLWKALKMLTTKLDQLGINNE